MDKIRNGSKVLLIMPPDVAMSCQPHLGLGLIASRLNNDGFNVLVVDYSYLASRSTDLPKISNILEEFTPDIVGVSLFSQHLQSSRNFVKSINKIMPTTPIVIGGPHVSLGNDEVLSDVSNWPGVKAIIRGEAEEEISSILHDVISGKNDKLVDCQKVDILNYCRPAFDLFIGGPEIETYPMQLSRGCPYKCVFCNVEKLSGRKFRVRSISDCISEVKEAAKKYKNIQFIKITDDAPNCDSSRFENFIEQYIAAEINLKLEIMQLRADHLTTRSCDLLKKAGQPFICIGVESADHNVLAEVNKGETLEHIERACKYVKEVDLPLVLCFVLGLPLSTKETDFISIKFAKKVQPVHCYWNIAQPMHGTKMYDYFLSRGKIYADNSFNESSLLGACYADTLEYSRHDRMKVQLIAQATTNELTIISIAHLLVKSIKLGAMPSVIKAMFSKRPNISKSVPRRW